MSDHKMVFEFDNGDINVSVECTAPIGATCRLGAVDWNVCHCEEFAEYLYDDEGAYHIPYGGEPDDKHRMHDSGECQVCLFFENDDCLLEENAEKQSFTIGRVDIEPVWANDYYQWKRVDA